MNISDQGIAFIKAQEGLSLSPYEDPPGSGFYSVGYGHNRWTGGDITPEQADALLTEDLRSVQACVNACTIGPIPQCQFDALCDFAFNLGTGALMGSTLRSRLNAGDIQDAADEFLKWDHAVVNGQRVVLPVLAARRQAEAAMFLGQGPTTSPTAVA